VYACKSAVFAFATTFVDTRLIFGYSVNVSTVFVGIKRVATNAVVITFLTCQTRLHDYFVTSDSAVIFFIFSTVS
jgi:hypothetical protein